ncbi:hypothetical protein, partial [Actinomyces massiliensis]|uniref:hypothetical protein n=1 Tax=Actinomyces massiliensis TaxID=461393 RepID=UPI001EE66C7B
MNHESPPGPQGQALLRGRRAEAVGGGGGGGGGLRPDALTALMILPIPVPPRIQPHCAPASERRMTMASSTGPPMKAVTIP